MKNITLLSVLITLSVLIGTTVKGEVQYTDIDPDITFPTEEQDDSHAIDLGFQDGDEIEISTTNYTNLGFDFTSITFSGQNGTTFSGDGDISEAIVDANTVIGPDLTFSQSELTFDDPGDFPVKNQDYYLAVRVESNSEYYYGWIRIAQTDDSEWTIKDFSMQDTPGTTITPDGSNPDPGTGGGGDDNAPGEIGDFAISKVEDVTETHSGADIEVSFNGAADETGILHYRIIVAPESMQESLTPEQAILLNPTRYHAVQPGQETYTTTLRSDQKDAEGSDIANKVSYVVFIFAVAEQGSEMSDKLSAPSSPITLRTLCQGPDEIKVRSLKNDDSEGPIELSFPYLENQEKNLEFRVFAIHNDNRNEFTLEIAEDILAENYEAIDPNTTENIFQLSLANDINGNPIDPQGFYKYAVLAVQDVVNTDISKLSELSNPVAISPDGFILAGETFEELKSNTIESSITFERSQSNHSIEIDIDKDGQSDLKITVNVSSDQSDNNRQITVVSLGAFEISTYPQFVLEDGDQISDLCSYTKTKLELLNISDNDEINGAWNNQQEKFLAIRKNSFQDKQLGWLKITTDSEKLTVHTSEVEKAKIVSGNDEISSDEINIFPSPASDIIFLSDLQTLSGATSIRIVDISGKEVMSIQEDTNTLESDGINIEDLKQGIYIIEVGTNEKRIVTKFIKN